MVVIKGSSIEEFARKSQLYNILNAEVINENEYRSIWRFYKKVATFSRAPVTFKEYQRMEKFEGDETLVSVVAKSLSRWEIPNENAFEEDLI